MKTYYVYPGSFCPPTYGHVKIVEQAAALFEKVHIICSVNPNKEKPWFTLDECKALWRGYALPDNVEVLTLAEFIALGVDPINIVMIRGLRGECDAEDEKKVMMLNWKKYGIEKFFFILADGQFADVSSSAARRAAEELDFEKLKDLAAPLVVSALLEKTLKITNLFLVVGPPGSGKSTILKMLSRNNPAVVAINTDEFSHQLKSTVERIFGEKDLIIHRSHSSPRGNEKDLR